MAEITVQECEEYVQKHQIQGLLKTAIEVLCRERPENPARFLKEYFERMDKDKKVSALYGHCLMCWLLYHSRLRGICPSSLIRISSLIYNYVC